MSRKAEEIVELANDRRRAAGSERERMRMIRDLYNGDVVVPLPELQRDEKAAVVNFGRMGINHMGLRVSSVVPAIDYVPINRGNREAARKRADMRRRVNHGWWGESHQKLVLRQRGRWFFGYATAPVLIRPNFRRDMPEWLPRSPLDTYPAAVAGVTDFCPVDCIFLQSRSVGWLRARYPHAAVHFRKSHPDDLVDVLEYTDADEYHIVASLTARRWHQVLDIVRTPGGGDPFGGTDAVAGLTLERVPNRAETAWAVIAGNISLERRTSNYEGMVGMYQAQAKLQALGIIAKQRSVFATEYLVASTMNDMPRIITPADPMKGNIGIVQGGTIDRWTPDPQFANDSYIDRLERGQRVEAGLPASFAGEAASNVRTGKTLSGLIDESVQPLIEEAHDIFAISLMEENRKAVAIDKAYWAGESKTFFVNFNGDKEHVTYTPDRLWEEDAHSVRYPLPGADVHDVNIATGQAVGAGVMSTKTAARLNPLVENPEAEHDQIIYEQLEKALLQQVLSVASTPGAGLELLDMAEMVKKVREDKIELVDAIIAQHQEAQRRQATPADAPEQAMPGIQPPGTGAEQPPAQFQSTPGQEQLAQLLFRLRAPQMATATERGA